MNQAGVEKGSDSTIRFDNGFSLNTMLPNPTSPLCLILSSSYTDITKIKKYPCLDDAFRSSLYRKKHCDSAHCANTDSRLPRVRTSCSPWKDYTEKFIDHPVKHNFVWKETLLLDFFWGGGFRCIQKKWLLIISIVTATVSTAINNASSSLCHLSF